MTEETAIALLDEQIPALGRARLPYHPAIQDRFGVDRGTWKVLSDNLYPTAEAPESIIAVLSYCRARKLDILKKPVHIVQVWDKKRGKMVDTFWPSINELRITAMRTGEYVGKSATVFGPLVTLKLGAVEITVPEWAQVTVMRHVKGKPRAFVGEQVSWIEYYAKVKRDNPAPNEMWATKSRSQISKCAEASALRTAFPEELGSDPTSEEMEGQEVESTPSMANDITSGIMGRLNGPTPTQGFSQEGVNEATDTDKPKRARRTKAEMEAVRAGPNGLVNSDGTTTEKLEQEYEAAFNPTETASVQAAETGPDSSASVTDALDVSQDQEGSGQEALEQPYTMARYTEEILKPTVERQFGKHAVETIREGYPADDEIYHLDGDEWGEDGRRDTYKNGEPFSSSGVKAGYAIYADHAPMHQDGPIPPKDGEFPPEFAAYIQTVEDAKDWVSIKTAMAAFYNTDLFKSWSLPQQNKVRCSTWEIIQENKVPVPDHASDVSAFRLWVEFMGDPDAITGTFHVLQKDPVYSGKPAEFKAAMELSVKNRLADLS